MVAELLIEIGTEEIPSDYIEKGLASMKQLMEACLKENRIEIAGGIYTYGTPRRLVLIGKALAQQQEDLVIDMTGPPKKVSFDRDGRPTKAAIGFAKKQGITLEELQTIETPKGEYLYHKKLISGRFTSDILKESLPKIIAQISWPKSMRWGVVDFVFVRPIHWITALFNGQILPIEMAGLKSSNTTRGHRFIAPQIREVLDVQDYLRQMENTYVIIDPQERKELVKESSIKAAAKVGGVPALDRELVDTVANLVEYPSAICGSFDAAFLSLPEAILRTAMKKHQKYFAVYNQDGQLMPNFVAINNTIADDQAVVRRGHERVLRARLSDAVFFFREDQKRPLETRLHDLKGVIYQAKLGTSFAKIERFTKLAISLGKELLPNKLNEIEMVARLSKCDLVTHIVTEFPNLQGIMGKEYALIENYSPEVCLGIEEHYLPIRSGGPLPSSRIGALVSISDRIDSICGCFSIGLEPSGNADPFALRRHAIAIIRISETFAWDFSLKEIIGIALANLPETIEFDKQLTSEKVLDFFRERYKQIMLKKGYKTDLIEAIISVEFDKLNEIQSRLEQLEIFIKGSSDFAALALTFKRVKNILKKQEVPFEVDPSLLKEPCENILWDLFINLKDEVQASLEQKNFNASLELLSKLRRPVDDFFDGVEVLIKQDRKLRENRVGILQHLEKLFMSVVDCSKFAG